MNAEYVLSAYAFKESMCRESSNFDLHSFLRGSERVLLMRVNPQVALCEEQLCVRAVILCWELVQGLSSNPQDFWPALRGFIGVAFHRSLLELEENQAPELTSTLKQVSSTPAQLSLRSPWPQIRLPLA